MAAYALRATNVNKIDNDSFRIIVYIKFANIMKKTHFQHRFAQNNPNV